jgi:ribosome modulation factor
MSLTDQAEMRRFGSSAYTEGYDAYYDGAMFEQNPYGEALLVHKAWADGWLDAEAADCVMDFPGEEQSCF